MQFAGGVIVGIVGTLIVNDPTMLSDVLRWLADTVSNEEIRNELSGK